MADQVTVFLDRERTYHDRDSKELVTVGPGESVVPSYVAKSWSLKPYHSPTTEPWKGYSDLTVDEVVGRLSTLDDEQREAVRVYETANKGRIGVLSALEDSK